MHSTIGYSLFLLCALIAVGWVQIKSQLVDDPCTIIKVAPEQSFLCGRIHINPTNALCCGGLVYVRSGYRPACCGSVGFDAQFYLCCAKTIVRKSGKSPQCCGKKGYDAMSETCSVEGYVNPRTNIESTCCRTHNGWRCCDKGEDCCTSGGEGSGDAVDIPGYRPACCDIVSIPAKSECCRDTMERIGALPSCCGADHLKPICCSRPGGGIRCCSAEEGYCCGTADIDGESQVVVPVLPDGDDDLELLTPRPGPTATLPRPYFPREGQDSVRPWERPGGNHYPPEEVRPPPALAPTRAPVEAPEDDFSDYDDSCCGLPNAHMSCCSHLLPHRRPSGGGGCCQGYRPPPCCFFYGARGDCCLRPQFGHMGYMVQFVPHYPSGNGRGGGRGNCCNTRRPYRSCCPLVASMVQEQEMMKAGAPQCCMERHRPTCCLVQARWPSCCHHVEEEGPEQVIDYDQEDFDGGNQAAYDDSILSLQGDDPTAGKYRQGHSRSHDRRRMRHHERKPRDHNWPPTAEKDKAPRKDAPPLDSNEEDEYITVSCCRVTMATRDACCIKGREHAGYTPRCCPRGGKSGVQELTTPAERSIDYSYDTCEGLTFNTRLHLCCDGAIEARTGRVPACCGRVAYDASVHRCCHGEIKIQCNHEN